MKGLKEALVVLKQGGVVGFPSEGVWSLGCDPENEMAVRELLLLKKRPTDKGLILVAGSLNQMEPYIEVKKYKTKLMTKWPGPHTWVVPTVKAPSWITGKYPAVALRVSDHPVILSICELFRGAIVSSSANVQGNIPARNEKELRHIFKEIIIVQGNLGHLKGATPMQDVVTDEWIRLTE